jgi:ubiquinol-cytochrome c reductase cytochrome c subunit
MQSGSMILAASALLFAAAVAVPRIGEASAFASKVRGSAALAGEAKRGQSIFVAQGCYLCHGRVGQGARGVGATIVPLRFEGPSFNAFLRHPTGSMPLYSPAVLSDADIAAISAYLHALPAPEPASRIPLLASYEEGVSHHTAAATTTAAPSPAPAPATAPSIDAGKAAFAENCAGCHGANREGGAGPNLQAEGQKRDAAAVAALIKAPPPGMPKLYPQPLSEAQVSAIAAFVVSR